MSGFKNVLWMLYKQVSKVVHFYIIPMEFNSVILAGITYVRMYVLYKMYDYVLQTNGSTERLQFLRTYACWQSSFACQYSFKSSKFLTYLRWKDANWVHWQVHTSLSHKRWQIGQILLLPINRKSHPAFPLAYLHWTLTHSKGKVQGHAHFDCEYFANGDRQGKHW